SDDCNKESAASWAQTRSGVYFAFDLPPASKRCSIVGDLTMTPGVPQTAGPSAEAKGVAEAKGGEHDEDEEPVLGAKIAQLDPSARRQLDEQLSILVSEPRGGATVAPMELIRKPPVHFERPHVAPTLPNYGKDLKAVPNPAWHAQEEKKRRFIDA